MKLQLLIVTILMIKASTSFSQGQLVFNNDINLVMSNDVYLVVDNANTNAISTLGTGGNIISEDEANIVKWNIGTGTGTYIVPFTTSSDIKIPLQLSISTPGTGSGSILFSTYAGATWDNNTYKPTGVTNMTNLAAVNNSGAVIDRFWLLDAQGYSTKPTGNILFTYNDAEHLAVGNTIAEPELKAERYEETSDNWEFYPVGGVVNTTSNTVSSVPFNGSDFVRSWTLIDQSTHLLPITLISFSALCDGKQMHVSWSTAQELETDYYVLQRSFDGINFFPIMEMAATGTSEWQTNYNIYLGETTSAYYKLIVYNLDGSSENLGIVQGGCQTASLTSAFAWTSNFSQVMLQTSNLPEGNYQLDFFSITGQLIFSEPLNVKDVQHTFILNENKLASGIYLLQLNATDIGNPYRYAQKIQVFAN